MGIELKKLMQRGPVDSIGLDLFLSNNGCARLPLLEKRHLAADFSGADLGNTDIAIRFHTRRALNEQEYHSLGIGWIDESVILLEDARLRLIDDQGPVVRREVFEPVPGILQNLEQMIFLCLRSPDHVVDADSLSLSLCLSRRRAINSDSSCREQ